MSARCSARKATAWPSVRSAVEPLAGLAYVHVRDGLFLESGGVAALSGASAHENTGYLFLGVRAADLRAAGQSHTVYFCAARCSGSTPSAMSRPLLLVFQGTGGGVLGCCYLHRPAPRRAGARRLQLLRLALQAKVGAFYQGELAAHAQTHAVAACFTWDF